MNKLVEKDLIVFDLDGTLAESKAPMDAEMVRLFANLLRAKRVAVIGGGKYSLFKEQLVRPLSRIPKELLGNLYLFPTTSTAFYRYKNGIGWKQVYGLSLAKRDRDAIKKAFREVFREAGYKHPVKTYGPVVEDRGTQVTFSALGQEIVKRLGKKGLRLKDEWKKKYTPVKLKMAKMMQKRLPHLEVHSAGFTSIDVTQKGIDKAYGVRQIEKHLHVPIRKMVFIGDALFPGGNDYAAKKTGVMCVPVKGPEETKKIIKSILSG